MADDTGILRFLTCGSVDDGKSTLIGRLLFDGGLLPDDQMARLLADSRRWGTQGDGLDPALLLDGLAAEREQGITIDVAYRYFATPRRSFVVADTPGHAQYTRNMVTGASTADAAVLLVDACKGVSLQTRRHALIVSLLGIRHIVLAVNKMDRVDWDPAVFEAIVNGFQHYAGRLELTEVCAIPVSALHGDNVFHRSRLAPWYRGPSLIEQLESIELDSERLLAAPLRFPVQWVHRPDSGFRGYAGTLASGRVRPGDPVRIQPSGAVSRVARIVTMDGDLDEAGCGEAVTLTLEDETDVSRGSMISAARAPAEIADQFQARVVWMHETPLLPGRVYRLKSGGQTALATVTELKHVLDVDSLEQLAASSLELNAIGVCTLALDSPIAFDPYSDNRDTGSFILVDRLHHHTLGAGMLVHALRRSFNIHRQHLLVDTAARQRLMGHGAATLWFTGLSGAGKSTIANAVEQQLHAMGVHTVLLDGDNVRHGLNRDLGFTDEDRVENIRRVAEVAKLMTEAGLVVLTAFISPFRAERAMARALFPDGAFIEIFVDVPLAVAEQRDPKGLYRKARSGQLANFTGISSPYEPPESPELVLTSGTVDVDGSARQVIDLLQARGLLHPPAG